MCGRVCMLRKKQQDSTAACCPLPFPRHFLPAALLSQVVCAAADPDGIWYLAAAILQVIS